MTLPPMKTSTEWSLILVARQWSPNDSCSPMVGKSAGTAWQLADADNVELRQQRLAHWVQPVMKGCSPQKLLRNFEISDSSDGRNRKAAAEEFS